MSAYDRQGNTRTELHDWDPGNKEVRDGERGRCKHR